MIRRTYNLDGLRKDAKAKSEVPRAARKGATQAGKARLENEIDPRRQLKITYLEGCVRPRESADYRKAFIARLHELLGCGPAKTLRQRTRGRNQARTRQREAPRRTRRGNGSLKAMSSPVFFRWMLAARTFNCNGSGIPDYRHSRSCDQVIWRGTPYLLRESQENAVKQHVCLFCAGEFYPEAPPPAACEAAGKAARIDMAAGKAAGIDDVA